VASERARERTLGLDFRRPGSPAQGVQAVPEGANITDDAEDTLRPDEDQS